MGIILIILIAFIGDSYTLGANDEISNNGYGFAGQVAIELNADYTRQVSYTFPVTNWEQVESKQPDMIVIELGIHTITDIDPTPDDEVANEIRRAMVRAKTITDNVVYVEIPWRTWGDEKNTQAKELNTIIHMEAAANGVRVARIYDALEACGWACVGSDDIHPNDKGHWIITEAVLNAKKVHTIYLPVATNGAN